MTRIVFPKGEQRIWINKVLVKTRLNCTELAGVCGLSNRTIRDWRNEKYTINKNILLLLCRRFHLKIPKKIKELPDHWHIKKGARKGALRRLKLYGPPGTPEGRRKGGIVSQKLRREHPEKYAGCNLKKEFIIENKSVRLAEVVGILLGDGGITDYQVKVTVNKKDDADYAKYVAQLMCETFGERPAVYYRSGQNVMDIVISGIGLVEKLAKIGLFKGNKIAQQVDFPQWIWSNSEFQKACVRGLIDTDGGVYFHKHWTNGIKHRNVGLCFTSFSKPLMCSVSKVLNDCKLNHSIIKNKWLFMYNLELIKRYFAIIGSNNPKHRRKLEYHLNNSKIIDNL